MKLSSRQKGKLRRKAKYWARRQQKEEEWVEIYTQLLTNAVNNKRNR
jgi:hypothetical protein